MGKLLTTGEMLDLWLQVRDRATPGQKLFALQAIKDVEGAFTRLALTTAEVIGVEAGDAELDIDDMCGLCVALYPLKDGDPIPDDLKGFDPGADWNAEGSPLMEGGD